MDYDHAKPIYERGAETSFSHELGRGFPTDYRNHGAVPDPNDLSAGLDLCVDGLFRGPLGVTLPFDFWDARANSDFNLPNGAHGWQYWKEGGKLKSRFHTGTDHPQTTGTAIRCVAPGVVICADNDASGIYGKGVFVYHGRLWRENRQYWCCSLYAHCDQALPRLGVRVGAGEVIAHVGSTGFSTGAHLHFEYKIKDFDPRGSTGFDLDAWHDWEHTLDPRIFDVREIDLE